MNISDKLILVTILISAIGLVFSIATFFYFLRERKRVLSAVIYEKQVEACSEIMMRFADIEILLSEWSRQRNGEPLYSKNYQVESVNQFEDLRYIYRKYSLTLPEKLLDEVHELLLLYRDEIDKMHENVKAIFNEDFASDKFDQVQLTMRDFFGIEKLAKSNVNAIHHFEKKSQ